MRIILLNYVLATIAPAFGIGFIILITANVIVLFFCICFLKTRQKGAGKSNYDNQQSDGSNKRAVTKVDYEKLLLGQAHDLANDLNDKEHTYHTLERRIVHDKEFMMKVNQLLEKNQSDHEYSVTRLCSDLNMERSGVYRIIQRNTCLSPINYISSRRIAFAAKIIEENPNLSDAEVAAMSGFNSAKSLRTYFLKHTGICIQAHRQNVYEKIDDRNQS